LIVGVDAYFNRIERKRCTRLDWLGPVTPPNGLKLSGPAKPIIDLKSRAGQVRSSELLGCTY
jgi:hypothetical protein